MEFAGSELQTHEPRACLRGRLADQFRSVVAGQLVGEAQGLFGGLPAIGLQSRDGFRNFFECNGKASCRFGELAKIIARHAHGAESANKFDAETLFYFFEAAQMQAANLSRRAHMSSAAGIAVEVGNLHNAEVTLAWRQLAQLTGGQPRLCLRAGDDADGYGAVFRDDLVGQLFHLVERRLRQAVNVQIDGGGEVAEMKGDGWRAADLDEGSG